MRVFVTGGTGTIGTPVVAELLAHGHTVLALARSDRSAQALSTAGAEPVSGAISDHDVLRAAAAEADGAISLAFTPDYEGAEGLTRAVEEETAARDGTTIEVSELFFNTPARMKFLKSTPTEVARVVEIVGRA